MEIWKISFRFLTALADQGDVVTKSPIISIYTYANVMSLATFSIVFEGRR